MKIMKYVLFIFMYLLSLLSLYSVYFTLYRLTSGEEIAVELADSRFENARLIYKSFYSVMFILIVLVLFYAAKKIKAQPLLSFKLLLIPIIFLIIFLSSSSFPI